MSVLPFPSRAPTAPPHAAGLDVLRERHAMLAELGHAVADEDGFVGNELVVSALMHVDAAVVATTQAERRRLLVRGATLFIAEIERIDRRALFQQADGGPSDAQEVPRG